MLIYMCVTSDHPSKRRNRHPVGRLSPIPLSGCADVRSPTGVRSNCLPRRDLTAFATRPFLKWRDIYDLWWIGTQTDARLELATVVPQFLHNVSAYDTIDRLSPAQALRKFLEHDPAGILKRADPDLKRWVPAALWEKLHPRVTAEMIEYTRHALLSVADAIEKKSSSASLKRIRQ